MSDYYGVPMPNGEGPIFDAMRQSLRAIVDTLYIPGQTVADQTLITPATGWAVSDFEIRKVSGPLHYIRLDANRTGGAITVPADGNVAPNIALGTLAAEYRPIANAAMHTVFTGPVAVGWLNTSGVFTLSALAPGSVINAGFRVELGGLALCPQMPR